MKTGALGLVDAASAICARIEAEPRQLRVAFDDIRMAPLRRFPYVVYFVVLPQHATIAS